MSDPRFLGDYSGFCFLLDDVLWEVHMNAKGYLILKEPNEIVGEYTTWEEFKEKYPGFAGIMFEVIKRKMNETIAVVQQWQIQDAMPEVMPAPPPLKNDDCMYHRAYQ